MQVSEPLPACRRWAHAPACAAPEHRGTPADSLLQADAKSPPALPFVLQMTCRTAPMCSFTGPDTGPAHRHLRASPLAACHSPDCVLQHARGVPWQRGPGDCRGSRVWARGLGLQQRLLSEGRIWGPKQAAWPGLRPQEVRTPVPQWQSLVARPLGLG